MIGGMHRVKGGGGKVSFRVNESGYVIAKLEREDCIDIPVS